MLWGILAVMADEMRAQAAEPALMHIVIVLLQPVPIVVLIAFFGWLRIEATEKGWRSGSGVGRKIFPEDDDRQA